VIGLCAAALGRDRTDDIGDLAALRFGVRADRRGTPVRDYHTIGGGTYPLRPRDVITDYRRANALHSDLEREQGETFGHHVLERWYGAPKYVHADPQTGTLVSKQLVRNPLVTERWYLSDAAFVAALQHTDCSFLSEIAEALEHPRRLLWLGRKSCPPSGTLAGPLLAGGIEQVFEQVAPLPSEGSRKPDMRPWGWIESQPETGDRTGSPVQDQPVTFASDRRSHTVRWERRVRVSIADTAIEWNIIP
jgi:CRISPR system Cascade subunit CasD